jgi:hypothetical protein
LRARWRSRGDCGPWMPSLPCRRALEVGRSSERQLFVDGARSCQILSMAATGQNPPVARGFRRPLSPGKQPEYRSRSSCGPAIGRHRNRSVTVRPAQKC